MECSAEVALADMRVLISQLVQVYMPREVTEISAPEGGWQ
jgi:hypothetical protein